MNWMDLDQDRGRWWALVNVVITYGFHKIKGISGLAEDLLASQSVSPSVCRSVSHSNLTNYFIQNANIK
jgi:hypothetical protein